MRFERQLIGDRCTGRTSTMVLDVVKWCAADNFAIVVARTQAFADAIAKQVKDLLPARYREHVSARSSQWVPMDYTKGMDGRTRIFVDHDILDTILDNVQVELARKLNQGNTKVAVEIY